MNTLDGDIRTYLTDTLGFDSGPIVSSSRAERLPPYLSTRYRLLDGVVGGTPVLFVADLTPEEEPPASIRKHLAQILARLPEGETRPIVYVRERITPHNRKRLIQSRVQFLVPGNQMHLPELGLALRERFVKRPPSGRPFRPATQAILIDALLRSGEEPLRAADLAPRLGYSAMTVSRAFDDLDAAKLTASATVRKERIVTLTAPRRAIWEAAQRSLSSPVKARRFVQPPDRGEAELKAGISALADYSMLAGPRHRTIALSKEDWEGFSRRKDVGVLPLPDTDSLTVEVWTYSPRPGLRPGLVDPLSLYLSLAPGADERVEQALQSMIEGFAW